MKYLYRVEINGDTVRATDLIGIAYILYQSACYSSDRVTLIEMWAGDDTEYDPVLHHRSAILMHRAAETPCPPDETVCKYYRDLEPAYLGTYRRTAVRCEVVCPQPRCGALLRPRCVGGCDADYAVCLPADFNFDSNT